MAKEQIEKSLIFKIADQSWEFDQINKLNYETFVNEIPQHSQNEDGVLIDKFNDENTYFICLYNKEIIGMIAIRSNRPFSLDAKLENLETYLPDFKAICEIRLLAVKAEHRNTRVFYGLSARLAEYCHDTGYDLAIISGTLRQARLYKHLGFVPFGPVVGTQDAQYQPMYLTWGSITKAVKPDKKIDVSRISMLPGPVEIKPVVRKAISDCPISHRSEEFLVEFASIKKMLCKLVNAKNVEIVMGSGTLSNDIVAGQLSLLSGKGIVLSNGEFGDRLLDHASRIKLNYIPLKTEWSLPFDYDELESVIKKEGNIGWLWMVHCETSSGALNDLERVKKICKSNDVLLNLDTISSIGTTKVDLEDVYLATCTSGKGLESLAGLSMIFYNHSSIKSNESLPRYLDLVNYVNANGVPFTISSNLLSALSTSLKNLAIDDRIEQIDVYSKWLRIMLKKAGYKVLVEQERCISSVITIVLPLHFSSTDIGNYVKENGFLLSYQSAYLIERNWVQICIMGNLTRSMLENLMVVMEQAIKIVDNR